VSSRSERINRLADLLRGHLAAFGPGERITAVHLFGVDRGKDLSEFTVAECKVIAADAGLKESLGIELHKGVRLSRHVVRRPS
jgi:hypothetical protein